MSAPSAPRALPKRVIVKPDDSDHFIIIPVFLFTAIELHDAAIWAPYYTLLAICSQIGLPVDGAVGLKKYFHNDEVDCAREVPGCSASGHHEQEIVRARKSQLIKI